MVLKSGGMISGNKFHLLKARDVQILGQIFLLAVGVLVRDFSINLIQMALCLLASVVTQLLWSWKVNGKIFSSSASIRSAIITGLGTSLLLRADNLWVHALVVSLAISSKFLIRFNGKHLFNPANFAVIIAIWLLPGTWVSSGQWGQDIALVGWFLALGGMTTVRAKRWDIGWFFLIFYLLLLAFRVLTLEQKWTIWAHQLQNGSLLLFSFFMISDPKTTPNHPLGRLLFAASVAIFAFVWQFKFFNLNGFLWSLFLLTPLVPFIDSFFPADQYAWDETAQAVSLTTDTANS
jgi:Na+-transporting NADH:ubiquinone oxidoreductase subunit NqrB